MTLAELTPDTALAALLDGNVLLQTSEYEVSTVKCYSQAGLPNKGLADEFITVQNNGAIRSMTRPIGVYRGNLALTIYCKAQADNTAMRRRIRSMIEQCEELVNGATSNGFWYGIDADNVIVPVTIDPTTGYGTTTINVEWHTL